MQTSNSLSITESIKFGFNTFFQNKLFLLGFLVISFLIGSIPDALKNNSAYLTTTIELITSLITMYLGYGFCKGILNIIDNKQPVTLKILTQTSLKTFLNYLLLTILISAIVLAGFLAGLILSGIIAYGVLLSYIPEIINIALTGSTEGIMELQEIPYLLPIILLSIALTTIPVIYLSLRFSAAELTFVDLDLPTIQNIKESSRLTEGHKAKIFLFWITLGLFNLAGALCLLIGLLITIPASSLAAVHFYRSLKNLKN